MEHNQAFTSPSSLPKKWHLICEHFNNVFVQADLKYPVWIQLPRGYKSKSTTPTCLRLKESLYGLSVAPKLWYQYLQKGLKEDNFQESAHDECLFFQSNMIIFLYMDDVKLQALNV